MVILNATEVAALRLASANDRGYIVDAIITLRDYTTRNKIIEPYSDKIVVQVPPHCVDDSTLLEMHLEFQARLRVAYHLRRLKPVFLEGKRFVVQGQLVRYTKTQH
jgi:hypothetical protein